MKPRRDKSGQFVKGKKRKARARSNPPARPARARPAGIPAWRFGRPEVLVFKRYDGRRFRHKCGPQSRLLVPKAKGAQYVVLEGVRVGGFLEG